MSRTVEIIRGATLVVMFAAIAIWVLVHSLKRSDDPTRLLFKWLLSAPVVWCLVFVVAPMVSRGGYGAAFGGVPLAAVCGLAMAIIWRHSIASMIAKPFGDLYDGGDAQVEPKPFYSVAVSKRKRGKYDEAAAEVRKQLDKFPNDVEGQLLLAEIQAENLNDLPGAEITIHRLCNQPGHPPRQIAMALNTLADWHLKFAQDREAARQALEKIAALLPESEMAALAAQRIAHLATTEHLLEPYDRRRMPVAPGVQNLGLLSSQQQPKAPEANPATQAAEYVKHLEEHPLDTEAREKLAVLYAEHYQKLELAADQLEQLIAHPNQPPRRVIHWLNLLADLQVRHSAGYETVKATLERIIDLFPNMAAAQLARNRIDLLKLELKGIQKTETVKLGDYEQDIGIKQGPPRLPQA